MLLRPLFDLTLCIYALYSDSLPIVLYSDSYPLYLRSLF
jgi:hypothetical protein